MRLSSTTIVIAGLVVLISTEDAFAWGPAMHIGLASDLLSDLSPLPAAIAAILGRQRLAYYFGNVAADVVFAKRLSRVKQFCHHWSTAFRLLDAAEDDRSTAFAYGYLSHLAADTVAHGKFIPRQVALSDCSLNFGHLYWELRADSTADDPTWRLLTRVLRQSDRAHHRVLEQHIKDTFLPYDLNRLFFRGMNAVSARRPFRRSVAAWGHLSSVDLSDDLIDGYRGDCLDRIRAIISDGTRSALLREDPNGTSALMQVRVRRRESRRLKRRGLSTRHRILERASSLAPKRFVA